LSKKWRSFVARGFLGELEQAIMLAVLRLGDNAYGVPIREELTARIGRKRSFGTIYTTLERLADKGFVTARVGDPTPERGGRAKRFYRLTAKGHLTLSRAINARHALERGLGLGIRALCGA
jgi:PadR family transcriptional regulator, regulatory protein PadR